MKVTDKGQITLPAETLRAMRVKKGTELLLVQEGDRIILVKAVDVGRRVAEDTKGFEALGLGIFDEVWNNEEDEVWNEVA